MLLKKKTAADIVAEDRKIIEQNASTTAKLAMLAGSNTELSAKLIELSEKLKYLKPTDATADIDKKVGAKIGDIKIELSRSSGDAVRKTESLISEILSLLVGRQD